MKKIIIVTTSIIVTSLVVLLCIFVLPELSDKSNTNSIEGQQQNPKDNNYLHYSADKLQFICDITEAFVGDEIDLQSYFFCTNIQNFNIYIKAYNEAGNELNESEVVVDNLKITSKITGKVKYKVFYKLTNETTYKSFSYFEISYFENLDNVQVVVESLDINKFLVTFTFDEKIDDNSVLILSQNATTTNVVKNSNSIQVEAFLENSLTGNVKFQYEKLNKTVTKIANLIQDKSFFRIRNNTTLMENESAVTLFLTNDNANHNPYFYSNTFVISKGFALVNPNYVFNASNDCIRIEKKENSFVIFANSVGSTLVNVTMNGETVFSCTINVCNVEVLNANSNKLVYTIAVNEQLDISPSVVEPSFAIYDVDYNIQNGNEFTSIQNGIFTSSQAGDYTVEISVGNYSYQILVTVEIYYIYFGVSDVSGEEVEEIYATVNEPIMLSFNFALSLETPIDSEHNVSYSINGENDSNQMEMQICVDKYIISFKSAGEYILVFKVNNTNYVSKPIKIAIN